MLVDDEIGVRRAIPDLLDGLCDAVKSIVGRFAGAAVALVRSLGTPTCASLLLRAERAVSTLAATFADEITASLVGAAHRAEEVGAAATAATRRAEESRGVRLRAMGPRAIPVRFLGGSEITIKTPYWAQDHSGKPGPPRKARGKSGSGCYPVLDHLGFVERTSPALAACVARQSASLASFREAEQAFAARGVVIDGKTVRRLSQLCAERALRARDAMVDAFEAGARWTGGELAGMRVAVALDGGRTRTRVSGKRGRRREKTGRRSFKTPWREPKVVVLYECDEKGKKTKRDPIYEGTFESWDDAFRIFAALCARRGVGEARELVIIGDGSDNIWDRVDAFVAKIGIDPSRVARVVDFYHASEHVHALADLCKKWSAKRRQHWIARAMRKLRAGQIEAVIEAGEKLQIGRRSPAVEKELNYFRHRKESMRYAALRARGLPIGSGVVESAIRRVVNLRMKGPGIFWEVDNAERMLILRAHLKSNRWHELEDTIFAPAAAAGPRRLLPRERTRAA